MRYGVVLRSSNGPEVQGQVCRTKVLRQLRHSNWQTAHTCFFRFHKATARYLWWRISLYAQCNKRRITRVSVSFLFRTFCFAAFVFASLVGELLILCATIWMEILWRHILIIVIAFFSLSVFKSLAMLSGKSSKNMLLFLMTTQSYN